jgi:L-ribulose-5-phosphate 3-epimerase UlaE
MIEKESVEVAVESAKKILNSIEKSERVITEDDLDLIIRQSFLYQFRSIENRSEITKDIQNTIEKAIEKITNEI